MVSQTVINAMGILGGVVLAVCQAPQVCTSLRCWRHNSTLLRRWPSGGGLVLQDFADADTCLPACLSLPPRLAQLIKLYRTKSAADLSYFYLALYALGLFFITVYVRSRALPLRYPLR